MKLLYKLLRSVSRTAFYVSIVYAVLFSFVGTALLIWAGVSIYRPIGQVRSLVSTNPKESAYMKTYRKELQQNATAPIKLKHTFVPFDSIAEPLKQAVLAAEDDGFYLHPGFDISAILSAYERNRSSREVKFGGSTLTQQVAKNLFLSSQKNYQRKAMELMYALLMEQFLDKDRIFELYLNYAQFGPELFGCGAAAQEYFSKPASKLTQSEAIRLAAVLARPAHLSPFNHRSVLMQKRTAVIAANLHRRGRINDTLLQGYSPIETIDSTRDSSTSPSTTVQEINGEQEHSGKQDHNGQLPMGEESAWD